MPSLQSFALPVQLPFDWEYLLAFLRLRATPGVETVTHSTYTRTITGASGPQVFTASYNHAMTCLQVSYQGNENVSNLIEARVRHIFKPDVNTLPIEAFLGGDSWLAMFVTQQPGLRVPGGWSAFEIAVRAILGQQVSVPAATTLMGRLVHLTGTRLSGTEWLFPTPEQVKASSLAGLGVPGSRMETVKLLATFFAENGDDCLNQPGVKERLLAIKGIGKWTAGYILMRTAESEDHWPEGDLILRKALSQTNPLIALKHLEQTFKQWSPYRSYATIHIWRGYVSSRNSNGITARETQRDKDSNVES